MTAVDRVFEQERCAQNLDAAELLRHRQGAAHHKSLREQARIFSADPRAIIRYTVAGVFGSDETSTEAEVEPTRLSSSAIQALFHRPSYESHQ
jgi:hypothetical protein